MTHGPFTEDELLTTIRVLETVADDLSVMAAFSQDDRKALQRAAGIVMRPDKVQRKKLVRAMHKRKGIESREKNAELRKATGIRSAREQPRFLTPDPALAQATADAAPNIEFVRDRMCYVCKQSYASVHHFYDQLCVECGNFNYSKRTPRADLTGRIALITGARVKIGFQAALILLRQGARVIVTTRFPHDAAERYAAEKDFLDWKDRLQIFGLDLRHTPSVEKIADELAEELPHLDYIIHNACQTIRRPAEYYAHLMDGERRPASSLPQHQSALVDTHHILAQRLQLPSSAELTQSSSPADLLLGSSPTELFRPGEYDADGQQVDRRLYNSWRLTLGEVPTVELLEVFLINAVAPFVLSRSLKPLMLRSGRKDLHIVNVSAMEGQFYRNKTERHPHTNMAKAALNMMTRTSAQDYQKSGIHMNAVDTGWVTDEDPHHLAAEKIEAHDFSPPLDIVDGAARIVDPIFHSHATGEHLWGLFLKDYRICHW